MIETEELISVIIPIYNGGQYIERCIKSIISQTYPNIEIIIVNDGSTDDTEYRCLSLKNKYENIAYYLQSNAGAGAARNTGMQKAGGKYVMFVDCDDLLHFSCIRKLYSLICEYEADIAACSYIKGTDRDIGSFLMQNPDAQPKLLAHKEALESFFYRKEIMGYPYCKLYLRDTIKNIMFNTRIRLGEDFCFVYDTLKVINKAVYINEDLYFYYQNEHGITHTLKFEDMTGIWNAIKNEMLPEMQEQELEKPVISKLFILAVDFLMKMKKANSYKAFRYELETFVRQNAVRIYKDRNCKISNRMLALFCMINLNITINVGCTIKRIFNKCNIHLRKAV